MFSPNYEQLSELTPIRITPDYARTPSDTLTLSRRGATTPVRCPGFVAKACEILEEMLED